MPDLFHQFGDDLQISASGDLAIVDGTTLGVQRALRRLLTNSGDYIWHLTYGAGLPAKIGSLIGAPALKALIRSQMALEAVVSQSPAPVITITQIGFGAWSVSIQYNDAYSGQQASLSFDLSE